MTYADRQHFEEITRVVVATVEALPGQKKKRQSIGRRALSWSLENKALIIGAFSLFGLAYYRINPLHDLADLRDRRTMVQLHITAANEMLDVGRFQEAHSEFESALKLDGNNSAAHIGLLKSNIFVDEEDKSYDPVVTEKRLAIVLDFNPNDAHARYMNGILRERRNEIEEALKNYKQAIELNPRFSQAYAGIGHLYDRANKQELAVSNYTKASELSPSNQIYLNNLGDLYYRHGDYEGALLLYSRALQLDHRFLAPYYRYANSHRLLDHLREAREAQIYQISLLNNHIVTVLHRNQEVWSFDAGNEDVFLPDLSSKQFYAQYSLALTLFLQDQTTHAAERVRSAEGLKVDDRESLKRRVLCDIEELRSAQPKWGQKLSQFEKHLAAGTITEQ